VSLQPAPGLAGAVPGRAAARLLRVEDAPPVVVAQGPLARLRELQRLLLGRGSISAEILRPPGCSTNS